MGGPADMDVEDDDRRSIAPLKSSRLGIINVSADPCAYFPTSNVWNMHQVSMLVEELDGKYQLEDERRAAATPAPVDRKGKGRAEV